MKNLVLIGMPGSGKTTFGKRIAEVLNLGFVDTDSEIEKQSGCNLQTALDRRGLNFLRKIEEEIVCGLDHQSSVISTGGSVVYSDAAMQHLKKDGVIIYLKISLKTLLMRVDNAQARGLVKLPATTLQGLFHERKPLYERWQEVTLENDKPLTAFQFSILKSQLGRDLKSNGFISIDVTR